MTPCRQLIRHDPANGQFGDCARSCVAALLDKDPLEVPHFGEGCRGDVDADVFDNRIADYLRTEGLAHVVFAVAGTPKETMEMMAQSNSGVFYMLGCTSPTAHHYVVCRGNKLVCDPADYPGGIDVMRADDNGLCWLLLLIPLILKAKPLIPGTLEAA